MPVMPRADPADIGILVSADDAPERPAAFLALNQGRKQVLVALAFLVHLECPAPAFHNLLCLLKDFRLDDAQFGLVHHQPLRLVLLGALAGQEIRNLLLAVNDFPCVKLIA